VAAALLAPLDDVAVEISSHGFELPGRLTVPEPARGVIVFAPDIDGAGRALDDGSVAARLCELGFGTLVFDLLAPEELHAGGDAVDLDVLAVRLLVATRWLRAHLEGSAPAVAYFGVRTSAAAALLAAAEDPSISAVVVRSGRLHSVVPVLDAVHAATLLVVGEGDPVTRDDNMHAASALTCDHSLVVVPNAGDRFVEPGTLDTSTRLAGAWFLEHLPPTTSGGHSHEQHR
jgi:putative phosphoribosyl transferase